ncbi:hypothetical protein E6A57_06235 [Lactobacillus crispatus]|uniref:hypothetical protein n=1 Tax=Lactobacillus crispatus TaxID=47770 RepID=UPI0013037234|nr:hypothetical protein [Lactobacillus crispatus]QGY95062.1 hypothetical protein E6A57_06235 [Lactobacillus crispatus]
MNNTNETTDIKQTNESQDTVKTTETNETAKTTDKNGEKQENNDQKSGLADQITKIRTKMQKRIDAEAGSKNAYKQKLEESQKQIETLTQKLNAQNKGDQTKQEKEVDPALKKALDENKSLKAQIARSGQIRTVAAQFEQAGVTVPENVLKLVVPENADDKAVSANMQAISKFYDTIVSSVRKSFMSAPTPRVTGSDTKPFSKSDLSKITDPVKRIELIKQHLKDFE